MPAIIRFLGYNPLPAASTLAEELVRQRTGLGLSQKESAGRIGVDSGTLAKWERGEREPTGAFLGRVNQFLHDGEASVRGTRGVATMPWVRRCTVSIMHFWGQGGTATFW